MPFAFDFLQRVRDISNICTLHIKREPTEGKDKDRKRREPACLNLFQYFT